MSAGRVERADVLAAREDWDLRARGRGHLLCWQLGATALRRGYAYVWDGRCGHCGAELTVGWSWTSCPGVRDARDVACSVPGTAVLTEIETERAGQLLGEAIVAYVTVIAPVLTDAVFGEIADGIGDVAGDAAGERDR